MPSLDDDFYWYVLFVRTGAEEKLVRQLASRLRTSNCEPFVPKKAIVFRRHGHKSLSQKICFPGYVFVESDKPAGEFIPSVFSAVRGMKDVYRYLRYGDSFDISMRENEKTALNRLLGRDRCMDMSKGFREGDSVRIMSGCLAGYESSIVKVNRNKNEAVVNIEMFGMVLPVSVGLELVDKNI